MISSGDAWLLYLFGAIGTYGIRVSFLAFADRMVVLPPLVQTALRMIPPAALAALVAPAILRPDGNLDLLGPRILAAALAGAAAWKTSNLLVATAVGIGALVGLDTLGWTA